MAKVETAAEVAAAPQGNLVTGVIRTARPRQWVKNVLVLAAPFTASRITEGQVLLDAGIAKEVARIILPVGIYKTQYATCNPRSLMHFLSLRTKDERSADER